ncbi:MAG: hypothetical protein LBT04_01310 [Prevotellaceae bacterium]|nr:hypothetical protein [Prevotellaceae bacterium]
MATNLGVEDENAADFGDFYQWGRIADGHQTIGWSSSGITTKIIAVDATTSANQLAKTAGAIAYDNNPAGATEGGTPFWQVTFDADHYRKFITSSDEVWHLLTSFDDHHIWATSSYAKTANDPCPTGWHVPTRFEWSAIAKDDTGTTGAPSGGVYTTTYNTWRLPSASNATVTVGYNYHAGGGCGYRENR